MFLQTRSTQILSLVKSFGYPELFPCVQTGWKAMLGQSAQFRRQAEGHPLSLKNRGNFHRAVMCQRVCNNTDVSVVGQPDLLLASGLAEGYRPAASVSDQL